MFKSILILIVGILLGVALTVGGGYLYMQYSWDNSLRETYQQGDWLPDFDERIYDSTADLAEAKSSYERWVALGDVAIWSIDAGLLDNAEKSAEELLETSLRYRDSWNYGNAVHKAHIALGRLALRRGDIPNAIEELLLAGQTPGSPQLDSFGPEMILAFELLKVGEIDAVLDYFTLCERFWEMGDERLSAWRKVVESGEIPRFSPSL